MALLAKDTDAVFFNLMHQLVQQSGAKDLREGNREAFQVIQWIAPGYDEIPPESALIAVRCHDLTRSGISFLLPSPPNFERLVVALGSPASHIYLTAEVLHWHEEQTRPTDTASQRRRTPRAGARPMPDQGEIEPGVIVGCRFLDRLKPSGSGL
jgi:hypothetical protein